MTGEYNYKNPLAQVAGLLLRKLRLERDWDYEMVQKRSGISQNYFKALEVASFNLHISKCYTLYNMFFYEAPDTSKVPSIDSWMYLLSTITTLDGNAKKDNFKMYLQSVKEIAKNLSVASNVLKQLIDPLLNLNLFEKKDSKEIQEEISKNGLVYHLENFLINFHTFLLPEDRIQKKAKESVMDEYNNIPSLYLDFVGTTAQRLKSLPVNIYYSDLIIWESVNKERFEAIYVIVKDHYDPSHENDFKEFQYSYLINPYFKILKYCFLDGSMEVEESRKNFLKSLLKNIKSKEHKDRIEQVTYKIVFEHLENITEEEQQLIFNPQNDLYDLLQLENKSYKDYNVFWLYKLRDLGSVGFVAKEVDKNAGVSIQNTRNLILSEIDAIIDVPKFENLLNKKI